jgi:hypothetical protein
VSPLVTEKRWLDEWFRGTPVVIALADDNTLAVDVPLVHSFESGQSSVKPALAAVLDRVATSLRRQAGLRVAITAPSDGVGSNAALVSARAQQVRSHLLSRGVAPTRVSTIGRTRPGAPVQLRLLMTPPAIERLGEASLRVPLGADAGAGAATAAGGQTVTNDAPLCAAATWPPVARSA